jgi:hypothetical protein
MGGGGKKKRAHKKGKRVRWRLSRGVFPSWAQYDAKSFKSSPAYFAWLMRPGENLYAYLFNKTVARVCSIHVQRITLFAADQSYVVPSLSRNSLKLFLPVRRAFVFVRSHRSYYIAYVEPAKLVFFFFLFLSKF